MKTIFTIIALAVGILASQAQISLKWAYTEVGGNIAGNGTLLVDTNLTTVGSYTGYQVTAISGTYLGHTILGLGPLSGVGIGTADDLLTQLNGNPANSYANDQLDYEGITIEYNPGSGMQYERFRSVPFRVNNSINYPDLEVVNGNNGTFSATPQAVPEPSSLALAGMGIAGWLILRRKK